MVSLLLHEEFKVDEFYLLVIEKEPGLYRLYVGADGEHYTHYDTGRFPGILEAVRAAKRGFDPTPFRIFPYAPFSKERVLQEAPHGFELLPGQTSPEERR